MGIILKLPAALKGTNVTFTRPNGVTRVLNNYAIVNSTITVASGGVTPALSPLVAGQSVSDIANFATIMNPANYATDFPGGTITRVEALVIVGISPPGAYTADTPLQADDIVELVIRVTDSNGTVTDFDTVDTVVQSATAGYSVTITAGRYARVTISPGYIGVTIALEITGAGIYDGVYADLPVTAFADGAAPYIFPGTSQIVLPATRSDASELVAGDVLTIYPGLVATENEDTVLTSSVKADGIEIASHTGIDPFDVILTPSQNGKTITLDVTADDGVNLPMISTTTTIAVPIPVSAGPLSLNLIDTVTVPTLASGSTLTVAAVDLSAVPQDDYVHAFMMIRTSPALAPIVGMSVDGVPATLLEKSRDLVSTRVEVAAFRFQRGTNATPDIVLAFEDNADVDNCQLKICHIENYLGEFTTASDEAQTDQTLDISLGVPDAGMVIAAAANESGNLSGTFTGATRLTAADSTFRGDGGFMLGTHLSDTLETPRTVTFNSASSSAHNAAVAVCVY
ncbi:MAG: hypothetical protein AAF317_04395 [Pseudomonadota bacterium]